MKPKNQAEAVKQCTIDGCDNGVHGHGWCKKHYARWLAGKDPAEKSRYDLTVDERFLQKFEQKGDDECWEWTASKCSFGYGTFWDGERVESSNRYSYMYFVGEISDGMCVCHSCDNPPCVNPKHLWLGTKADNNRDRNEKGRTRSGDVRGVKHGHAKLDESDVRVIRELYEVGCNQSAVAEIFDISRANVSMIGSRKTWTHVA